MYPNNIHINADGSASVDYIFMFGDMRTNIKMDGKITNGVIDVFTRGHCHSFALEMHRVTGWEMMAVYKYGESKYEPTHIMTHHPSGRLVDIHGFRDPALDIRNIERVIPVTEAGIMDFHGYFVPDLNIARPYVQTVLQQIGWTEHAHIEETQVQQIGA